MRYAITVLSVLAALTITVFYGCKPTSQTSEVAPAVKEDSLRRGEARETLPPSMFSDPFVAGTYQIAKDIPQVLDSLKCYCLCDKPPFNHVSLLSCFVDNHAAG